MIILHIACIGNNPLSGVSAVVPMHVIAQNKLVSVGFLNTLNKDITALYGRCSRELSSPIQLLYQKPFSLEQMPKPFARPDLVVFHECYRADYLSIGKVLRQKGIPYVICPHGELRREAQKKKFLKKKAANLLFFNRFIRGAAGIQLLSEAEKENTNFGTVKFVATSGIAIPEKQKVVFSKQGTKFLFIGRYEWRVKGLDMLFLAINKIAPFLRNHACSFSLYGPDVFGRLDQVRELVKKNRIEDLVTLHESVIGKEKEDLLLGADIFLQTSRHEGMPMGILEAMSYGLPCLLTEGTSLGNAVEEAQAGWFAGSTAEDIAAALRRAVLEKEKWNTYGNNAVSYVKQHHNWSCEAKKTLDYYRTLICENSILDR